MDSLQGRIVNDRQRLVDVALDNASLVRWNPDIQQELNVAIYDLKEENVFAPQDLPASAGTDPGPFTLTLSLSDNRLALDIRDAESGQPLDKVFLALTPFRRVIRDYFAICESYYAAIKRSTPQQIEAIDMGRRGLHNEGAELLRERLDGKVRVDNDTARRLFTLLCVLHMGVRNDFS